MTRYPIRLVRTAGPDGVEHAWQPGAAHTLCGVWITHERYAWPRKARCPQCHEKAEARLHEARDAAKGAGR